MCSATDDPEADWTRCVVRFGVTGRTAATTELDLSDVAAFLGSMSHEVLLDSYRVGKSSAATLASVNLSGGVHGGDRSLTAFGP